MAINDNVADKQHSQITDITARLNPLPSSSSVMIGGVSVPSVPLNGANLQGGYGADDNANSKGGLVPTYSELTALGYSPREAIELRTMMTSPNYQMGRYSRKYNFNGGGF